MNQELQGHQGHQKTKKIKGFQEGTPHIKTNRLHNVTLEHTSAKKANNISFDYRNKIPLIRFSLIGDQEINSYWLSQNQTVCLHKWQTGKKLNICFHKTHDLSDNALALFVKSLRKNFTKLTNLRITFVDCYNISPKGIEILSYISRNLPHLKDLDIDFCLVPGLTSQAAESLRLELIRNSTQIEYFSLGLEDENLLDDSDIELILLSISKYMKRLKHFRLELN